ncbi:methyltransferase-like protein 25 isoform X2 [Brienomyrus brachyistius]|uniref:methyltransferase-like protein 25 isoform X2 n=1 Tax=Brienomyrus brachyistius TaxID=42636 RepID=UPI0020B34708|nr:methyltransferase-like protein 25 isoform X2 [Brienomyrus brachyistius]
MSSLSALSTSIDSIKRAIDAIKDFLSISLCIANAHTVDFYTRDLWNELVAVPADSVLSVIIDSTGQRRAPAGRHRGCYGFSSETGRLEDVEALLDAARAHSLPALRVSVPLPELLKALPVQSDSALPAKGVTLEPDEFMNSKKSHEVQTMSGVVAGLAGCCCARQVIDVGSGKGYLCSFLSMQYGLKVFGIDASSTNTHGAWERNRKLKKYSKAYQRHGRRRALASVPSSGTGDEAQEEENILSAGSGPEVILGGSQPEAFGLGPEDPFLGLLSPEAVEPPMSRVPPCELTNEERERRKRKNLERKAQSAKDDSLYSPLTSYVTAETELRDIITDLQDAVVVGLHTCGDLAPSTLRMFVAKRELRALCSVSCCYHLLSEEFDHPAGDGPTGGWGFPMSRHLRDQRWCCGRNARMSACLALERVSAGQGLPSESLFFRAILHVILRDYYDAFKSEKRVGNVFSKATSFVDYVRRALKKLELDDSKLSDSLIQSYHEKYLPRKKEMEAFNMLKVSLAPCIEGLILLDRLCYLKEQKETPSCILVQLFDPLMSPRCYGLVGLKERQTP